MDNPFALFEDGEDPKKVQAAINAIKKAIDKAANTIWAEVEKHVKLGATDTASREAIASYCKKRIYERYYER